MPENPYLKVVEEESLNIPPPLENMLHLITGEKIDIARSKQIIAARFNNLGASVSKFLKLRLGNKVQKVKYTYEFDEEQINSQKPLLICDILFLEDRGMEFLRREHILFLVSVEIDLSAATLIESKEYTLKLSADYQLIEENLFISLCTLVRNRWRKEFKHDLENFEEHFKEEYAKMRKNIKYK